MRIFLARGSGVIGSRLIPELAEAGHDITATTGGQTPGGLNVFSPVRSCRHRVRPPCALT